MQYLVNGQQIFCTNKERVVGIPVSNDLMPTQHCSEVSESAKRLVGFIKRTFNNKSEKVTSDLYNSLLGLLFECCVQIWYPYYRKYIYKSKRIQRRIPQMIPRLRTSSYGERLEELSFSSLSKLKMRGDLIEVFEILE